MAVEDQRGPSVVPGSGAAHGGSGTTRRRHRVLIGLALTLAVLLIGALVASFVPVPYYAITPGRALDVSSLIKIGAAKGSGAVTAPRLVPHRGGVLLTDVELIPLRAIDYPYFAWFDHDATVIASGALTGPATAAQYNEQGVIDMANARQAATVVALRTLGYPVRAKASGVIVYQAEPGSPAAAALRVDDVITAIGSQPVTTFASLGAGVSPHAPGDVVALHVRRFSSGRRRVVRVRLGSERVLTVSGARYEVCRPVGSPTGPRLYEPKGVPIACLGLLEAPGGGGSEIAYTVSGLPFPVNLEAEGIVGPSAGLAFTLGLLDKLDRADLTGGRRVAATGTMSIDGNVGDVGGVAQKTVAVRNAGADVFLVPPQELAVARARAGSHLRVFAVSNISQAIRVLERVGGVLRSVRPS